MHQIILGLVLELELRIMLENILFNGYSVDVFNELKVYSYE